MIRASATLLVALAISLSGASLPTASAQTTSKAASARTSASQAGATKDAAAQAAQKAAADAARAAAAARAAEEATAAARAAAAQAEVARQAVLRAQAEREAAAAELEARAEAARAAAAQAQHAEEAKRLAAEAATVEAAAKRAAAEQEQARAAAAAVEAHRAAVENAAAANARALTDARLQAEAARAEAAQSEVAAAAAAVAAQNAAERAAEAEAAELVLSRIDLTDDERLRASEALDRASDAARGQASRAEEHAQHADQRSARAAEHAANAQHRVGDLLRPPALEDGQLAITSRSWLLCGGGYPGWSGPGLCASVQLDATSSGVQPGVATISMRIRNLSGLFASYAGSVLTGIGLSFLAAEPRDLEVEGPCTPTDQDCAAQWSLAVGNHAHMPNGIGRVGMKLSTNGILGGIASTCAAEIQPPQYDQNGEPVAVPFNPNGLFTNECYGDDWVTLRWSATAPVDLAHTEVSLRVQNGYPIGSGSTACIYSGSPDTRLENDCMPVTTVTPEPTTLLLLAGGLAGLGGLRRRRRRGGTTSRSQDA